MQKGLDVDFYDLFRHILKKWPILLAFVLLFGIGANVYGYRRASNAAEKERRALEEYAASIGTTADQLPEHMTAELAELRGALTEEEASFVEAAVKLYMYRLWASDKINAELIVGKPDQGDLEIVQTLYYANEGVQSATQVMTSAQKSYYNVMVKSLSGTDMSVTEKEISSPGILQPKWLLIGCVLGVFLGIFVVSGVYLLSGKLRTASDMEIPYGVPVLLRLNQKNKSELEPVAKGIQRLLKTQDKGSLVIHAVDTLQAKEAAEKLVSCLHERHVEVKCDLNGKNSLIDTAADSDAVLFIEQVGRSRYRDIEQHVSDCRKFCIPTVGCVVIE